MENFPNRVRPVALILNRLMIPMGLPSRILPISRRAVALLLVAILGPCGLLRADDFSFIGEKLPQRPGVPITVVDGHRQVVIDMNGSNPVILENGKHVTKRGASLSIVPGKDYAPGALTVVRSNTLTGVSGLNSLDRSYAVFNGQVMADQDMQDVILVLFTCEDTTDRDGIQVPALTIRGARIGNLAAGRPKGVSLDFQPAHSNQPFFWSVCFFSGGKQIRTNEDNEQLNNLFDIVEKVAWRREYAARLSDDQPVAIFRHFPLKFSAPIKKRFAKKKVTFTVHVAPDGTLDMVDSDEDVDRDLMKEVLGQLSYWLFLPKTKGGQAYPSTFVMPIQF